MGGILNENLYPYFLPLATTSVTGGGGGGADSGLTISAS